MNIKIKTKTMLVGLIITFIGLAGISYEVIQHIEILNISYQQYPLSVEQNVLDEAYNEINDIELNVYNYNVEFIPNNQLDHVTVEVISTNYQQNYIEPVKTKKVNNQLIIDSAYHRKNDDFYLPDDWFEYTKNQVVMTKYFVKNYNKALLKKNIVIPTFGSTYNTTETIRISYPDDATFTNLNINTNGNTIYVEGFELNDKDARNNLLSIINE